MDLGLRHKLVLVSGSTQGIGFATARQFAREGARVVLNGRSDGRLGDAVARLQAELKSADVQGVVADLSSTHGAQKLLREVPDVDVLVNNVGIFEPKTFEEISDGEWTTMFETNVMSGVRLARHYLPRMLARGSGRIVFVSSESALQIPAEMIHYGMTKTAQLAIARGLAERTRGTGVTVNSVLPGPTESEGVGEFVRRLAAQRGVSVEAQEREFFATNGAALRVDGGVVRAIA
jgi:NAD(P)-dependent dehydrogenase (short-subunit alcohol dehydrogenase family)